MEPYPMRWFRFYDEALNDPKVQQLPDAAFKYWVNLLCLANQGKPRGRFRRQDVAYALRMTDARAEKMLAYFMDHGLLEEDGDALMPHGWDARQFASDNVTERVREHRRNVTRNVPKPLRGTPPEAETDADTDIPPLDVPPGGAQGARGSRMAEGWEPSPLEYGRLEVLLFSREEIDRELVEFRDHYLSNGKVMKDWNAAFRNWMRRSRDDPRFNGGVASNGHKPGAEDEAMKGYLLAKREWDYKQQHGTWRDVDLPARVYDSVGAIGGFAKFDPENAWQRRDFLAAYKAWEAT